MENRGPIEWLRDFIEREWPGGSEEHRVRGVIRALCLAVLEKDEETISRTLVEVNVWNIFLGPAQRVVHRKGDPWGWFELEPAESQEPETEAGIAKRLFVSLLLSRPDEDIARAILGLDMKENMIPIQQLAKLTGLSRHTLRGRIYKARKKGEIDVVTTRGAILVNREAGLQIALHPPKIGRPKKAIR